MVRVENVVGLLNLSTQLSSFIVIGLEFEVLVGVEDAEVDAEDCGNSVAGDKDTEAEVILNYSIQI